MNSYKQSLYSGIVRIAANLVMILALFHAMYRASRDISSPSEIVFSLHFFSVVIPVWIGAYFLTRWIRSAWPAEAESLVSLPGWGETLVRWSLSEKSGDCRILK